MVQAGRMMVKGALFIVAALALSACSMFRGDDSPAGQSRADADRDRGGISLFGGGDGDQEAGIGVNSYLWRASLDTLNFMPLASADPFGGVIITDWYSPEGPDERFKLNVYVLDSELRANAVKVAVFRQTSGENGWQDAAVDPETSTSIEDSILTRARELRIAALNASG